MNTLHTSIISLSNLIWYRYNINTYSMYCRFKHIKYWVPQRLNPSINCELLCRGENSYQIKETPRKQNKVKLFFFYLRCKLQFIFVQPDVATVLAGEFLTKVCSCSHFPLTGQYVCTEMQSVRLIQCKQSYEL